MIARKPEKKLSKSMLLCAAYNSLPGRRDKPILPGLQRLFTSKQLDTPSPFDILDVPSRNRVENPAFFIST
jgi:hypothetical protein